MKIHRVKSGRFTKAGVEIEDEVIELQVFISADQYCRLQNWRKRFNAGQPGDDVGDEQAAALALVGALLRLEVYKDPP